MVVVVAFAHDFVDDGIVHDVVVVIVVFAHDFVDDGVVLDCACGQNGVDDSVFLDLVVVGFVLELVVGFVLELVVGFFLNLAVLELVVYDQVVVGVVLNLVQTLAEDGEGEGEGQSSLCPRNKLPSYQSVYFLTVVLPLLILCNQFVFVETHLYQGQTVCRMWTYTTS